MQDLKSHLQGIYVLAITPMQENFALDMDALRRNIDHFIAAGVHGIVVGGTYAEYPSMSMEERKLLFTTAIDAVAKRVPIICCTAASGTAEAIMLTKFAEKAGADGVMVTPPYVSEVRSQDMIYHFQQLDAAVNIPILIYNSSSIGVHLTPQDIQKVAKFKNVVGVKQGATEMHALVRTKAYAGEDISVMCASDGIILGALAIGYPGCTSTNANYMAGELVALYNEVQNGELKKAQERFYRWQPMRDMATKYGQPAMVKAGMEIMGLPSGPVRAPFKTLDPAAKAEIKTALQQSGILK